MGFNLMANAIINTGKLFQSTPGGGGGAQITAPGPLPAHVPPTIFAMPIFFKLYSYRLYRQGDCTIYCVKWGNIVFKVVFL